MRKAIVLISMILVIGLVAAMAWGSPSDDFARGNQAFQDKDYQKAIDAYNAVLATGQESANLYFNLGNAYFRKGDLGFAILNYLKARRLAPGDDDIRSNLDFARKLTSVQLEGVTLNPVNSLMRSVVSSYKLATLGWVSSLFFILLMILLIFRLGLRNQNRWLRPGIITALVVLFVFSVLTTYKYREDYVIKRGVIVATESEVRTGPTDQSDVELHGEQGLIVEIIAESGDYFNVVFENQRRGWIKKSLVSVV